MAVTHLTVLALGIALVVVAWRAGRQPAWRRFVLLLALAVIGSPLACLMWGVP